MIRSILVATDGSAAAVAAVRTGAELAASLGPQAQLHVAAVVDYAEVPSPLARHPSNAPDLLAEEAQAALAAAEPLAAAAGISPHLRLLEGDPVTAILKLADEVGADLLVVGAQGRNRLARLVLGSVAERLVHRSELPVVLARATRPEHQK